MADPPNEALAIQGLGNATSTATKTTFNEIVTLFHTRVNIISDLQFHIRSDVSM